MRRFTLVVILMVIGILTIAAFVTAYLERHGPPAPFLLVGITLVVLALVRIAGKIADTSPTSQSCMPSA